MFLSLSASLGLELRNSIIETTTIQDHLPNAPTDKSMNACIKRWVRPLNVRRLSIRIRLGSSINGVVEELHGKRPNLGLKYYNMCFNRDEKENLIESDGELHSLVCYYFAKKIAIVEIRVVVCVTSLITSSGSISASSSSSSVGGGGGGGVVVVHKLYKSDFWARNFDGGVGQRFSLGALEFRCKLIEYSIVSGYKYELIKNDEFRVTAKLALTELYGDVALSYNELLWYTKELKRRDPGNCVDLQGTLTYDNWANAYFCGAQYGEMFSSLAECFNSWIDKEHHLPITVMLYEIRMKMMEMTSDRRMECKNWKTILGPKMEVKLAERIEEARFVTVASNTYSYGITAISCNEIRSDVSDEVEILPPYVKRALGRPR
ncbi:hypothetical protein IFM89_030687 [Coptis chinensis]|uniref:Uncharacterized protein n=1 Tax=Coptis chinensis TaxID=261450 RepID=A0A835M5D7_9MAGN|nr:hypothetical protein IFM89_030687 [Coptis chinensis]